jgi:hypothetical protein
MSEPHGKTYRHWEPQRDRNDSYRSATNLPEGKRVFFLLDTVPKLDLRCFHAPYEDETRGCAPIAPGLGTVGGRAETVVLEVYPSLFVPCAFLTNTVDTMENPLPVGRR